MSIKIKPSKRNTNKHTDKGMNLLENSIDNYGVLESISVTEEGTIISGHARKELFDKKGMVAKEIKLADNEYPVILTNIKDDTKEYYEAQIMANTTAHHNYNLDTTEIEVIAMEYDLDIEELGVEIEELVMDGVEPEMQKLEAKEDDFDATPPAVPITVLGDLYEIGEHRLLCGDSTDSEQVAKLMNGNKADMVVTDPPYNVKFNGRERKDGFKHEIIENDNLSQKDFETFIEEFMNVFLIFQTKEVYMFCDWKLSILLSNYYDFKQCLCVVKNHIGMGGGYRKQTELCLYNGDFKSTDKNDILLFTKEMTYSQKYKVPVFDTLHPTQKPIELICEIINNSSNENDLVLDFFLGSGSTMVASHQLKRKCYGMELDPKYCDVIVKRMLKLDNTLKVKRNGIDCTKEWMDKINE